MAVKSKTDITTEIDTNLASGSNIQASEHRAVAKDIVDSYEDFVGSYTTVEIAALVGMTLRQRVFNTDDNDYEWYDGTRWVKEAHPKYKVYVAIINQAGTAAPVATVLENTLGGTVVWSRATIGTYTATLSGAFTASKTTVIFNGSNISVSLLSGYRSSDNTCDFISISIVSDVPEDSMVADTSLEIRVYY